MKHLIALTLLTAATVASAKDIAADVQAFVSKADAARHTALFCLHEVRAGTDKGSVQCQRMDRVAKELHALMDKHERLKTDQQFNTAMKAHFKANRIQEARIKKFLERHEEVINIRGY